MQSRHPSQNRKNPVEANPMEQMATSYDTYMKLVTLGREHALRKTTIDLAEIKPGERVLEVGCGTGTLTLAAKGRVGLAGEACGIDVIPKMIELSQRKAARAGATIGFQVGSIDNIPFPGDQFDAVLSSFMIFHMPEEVRAKGIREIYRVLKPRGRLLVLDMALPTGPIQRRLTQHLFGFMLEHNLRELLPLLQEAGFTDIEVGPANYRLLGLSLLGFVRGRAGKG